MRIWPLRPRQRPTHSGTQGVRGPELATDLDRAMMARALGLARDAALMGEVPVGAVVYRTPDATVLGEGYNRRESDRDPAAHAELLAIVRAARALGDWRLSGCSLAVTLEPCVMCAGLIVNARVDRVIYGTDDPKAGACRSLYSIPLDSRLNHRPLVIGGVASDEASLLLRGFFRGLRASRKRRPPPATEPPTPPDTTTGPSQDEGSESGSEGR